MYASPHVGRHTAPHKKRHARSVGFLAVLLLALLIAVVLFLRPPAQSLPAPEFPRIVVLDDGWTARFLAAMDADEAEAFVTQTAADLAAGPLGANALAWSGFAPDGTALFEDKTQSATPSSHLQNRSDPMNLLVEAAGDAGLAVYLTLPAPEPADEMRAALAEAHGLPLLALHPGKGLADQWAAGGQPLLDLSAGGDAVALALQQGAPDPGIVLGNWSDLQADPTEAVLLQAYAQGPLADPTAVWGDKAVQQTLAVTYPEHNNAKIYTEKLFLMGTSDPAQPLTLDGEPVTRTTQQGGWGVLVTLDYGETTFILQNGGEPVLLTVNRPKPPKKSNAKPPEPQPDGTVGEEAIGKKVLVTDAIASALSEPWDSGSIQATLYRGAAAEVVEVTEYPTGNKLTHAYRLSTGGWVRAATSTITDLPDAAFTGLTATEDAASRSTVLDFTGSGTPAVYHTWEGDTLTLTLLSAQWSGTLPESERFAASIRQQGKDLVLTLQFNPEDPLYGWAVNYVDGHTRLYLKHRPVLADGPQPLQGLTVLLDPGHGDGDNGAMGSGGLEAPVEKDVNLAVAMAARTRLEQLGATVTMTRTDDSFPTLGDRVTALNEQHPDLFISVHHNSIDLARDVNQVNGTEAYWFYPESEALAALLTQHVSHAAQTAGGVTHQDRGNRYGYYYVTRSRICPATLLEVGFLTNPAEYEQSVRPEVIRAEAGAIGRGVYEYFRSIAQ